MTIKIYSNKYTDLYIRLVFNSILAYINLKEYFNILLKVFNKLNHFFLFSRICKYVFMSTDLIRSIN